MQSRSIIWLLLATALCSGGCATGTLIYETGNREEVPVGKMIAAYATTDGKVIVDYQSILVPLHHRNEVLATYRRRAVFDLSHESEKYHRSLGEVLADAETNNLLPWGWVAIPRLSDSSKEGLVMQPPDNALGANRALVWGEQAGWFQVVWKSSPEDRVIVTQCQISPINSSEWWRTPVVIVGTPFTVVMDVLCLPVYIGIVCFGF